MITYSARHVTNYRAKTVAPSRTDPLDAVKKEDLVEATMKNGSLEAAYRELMDLREKVRKAELKAASIATARLPLSRLRVRAGSERWPRKPPKPTG